MRAETRRTFFAVCKVTTSLSPSMTFSTDTTESPSLTTVSPFSER